MSDIQNLSGSLQEVGQTSRGDPKIKVNGKWMYFKNKPGPIPTAGTILNIAYTYGGKDGKLPLIVEWQASNSAPAASSPNKGNDSPPIDEASLRFISNVVGSAISAGTIKDPSQIEAWFEHAKDAVQGKKRMTQAQLEKVYNKGPIPGVDDRQVEDEWDGSGAPF